MHMVNKRVFPAIYHKISQEVIGHKRILLKAICTLSFRELFFSETIRRMKLKRGIHAYDITLYETHVFYCQGLTNFVAVATKISIDL